MTDERADFLYEALGRDLSQAQMEIITEFMKYGDIAGASKVLYEDNKIALSADECFEFLRKMEERAVKRRKA